MIWMVMLIITLQESFNRRVPTKIDPIMFA